jgi:hypothetical protein
MDQAQREVRDMKRSSLKFLLAVSVLSIGLALIMSACAPDSGFNRVADYDVAVTLYDKEFDFGTVQTYSLPDTIIHLVEEGDDDNISRDYDEFILNLVRENIEALGYVEADTAVADPDVYFLVDVASADWVGWSYWSDYWYWYPGWGGWYPSYPPGGWYPSYTFTTGTLFINMMDWEHADEDAGLVPVVWTAVINGLLEDTSTTVTSRLTNNINQVFDQSPYL